MRIEMLFINLLYIFFNERDFIEYLHKFPVPHSKIKNKTMAYFQIKSIIFKL